MKRIGILGAGTWGMALARMLTVSGNDVLVWSAIEKEIDSLSTTRKHPNLPQMKIPDELRFTKSIEEVCKDKDILLFAVPSVFVRSTAAKARPYVADGQIIVDVAKGIEPDTLYTMTEILADELGKEGGPKGVRLVALSGPTHAEEVAIDLPTTIVSASKDMEAARFVQTVFTNNVMRVYTNGCSRYQFSVDNAVLLIVEHFGVKRFLSAFKVWKFFIFLLMIVKIHCSFLFSFLFFTQYLDNRIYHSNDDHGIHYGIRFCIRYDVKIHKKHTD